MRTRQPILLLALVAALLAFPAGALAQDDSSQACDADAITAAIEGGSEEGSVEGMADDPVATAASNNPVLTQLTQAVQAAGLVDTLNSAEALTVFAPTDCAFAAMDAETMEAAMADPSGLLTQVLGFHVIAGEQIASSDLSGEYETFTGETITVDGSSVAGQGEIVVPDVQTANATVHLIDTVLTPPSVQTAQAGGTEGATEGAATEGAATEGAATEGAATEGAATEGAATEGATEGAATEDATEGAATEGAATEGATEDATEDPATTATEDAEATATEEPADAAATPAPTDAAATPAPTDAAATPAPTDADAGQMPTGGVATGAGGTAGEGSLPLVAMGLLALLAIAGGLVWRRA